MGLDDPVQTALQLGHQFEPIQQRFERWLRANPQTWPLFVRFAREVREAGWRRFGVAAIVERIRWEVALTRRGADPFKINNDFRSRLARKLIDEDPSFAGFFETRRLQRW